VLNQKKDFHLLMEPKKKSGTEMMYLLAHLTKEEYTHICVNPTPGANDFYTNVGFKENDVIDEKHHTKFEGEIPTIIKTIETRYPNLKTNSPEFTLTL